MTLPDLLANCTPGPWECKLMGFDDAGYEMWSLLPAVADFARLGEPDHPDARLIALAPEMAALLIEARNLLVGWNATSGEEATCDLLARIDGLTARRDK